MQEEKFFGKKYRSAKNPTKKKGTGSDNGEERQNHTYDIQEEKRNFMEINAKSADRNLLLELSGELDHHGARNALREVELAVDAALPKKLVLDMGGVTFMDSSGIALILRAQQRMQVLDGCLLVCNVPQQARRVLDAAGIGRLVTIK